MRPSHPDTHCRHPLSLPPARIEQLTSLRFFAALAVLASHLWPLAEEANPLQPIARTLFHEGYAGVSFFFMLSGFILSHTYQAKLTQGTISRGKYLTLRIARIAPLHWLCGVPLAIWALATVGGPESGLGSLPSSLTNLALLQSWVPQVKWYFSLNEPSWSLSDELFFYTMFVWLAFLPLRRLGAFAALLLLGNVTMVVWLLTHGQGAITHDVPDGESTLTRTHWLTYIAPLPRLLDFVGGMLVYRAPKPRLSGPGATALEVGAIALLLGAMVAYPLLEVADAWRMQLAYLPFMALVIWAFGKGGGALSGFLARTPTLVLLGDASFALYLIHLPIIHAALALRDHYPDSLPLLPLCGGTALIAIGLSVVVYRKVELPLLARSRRMIGRAFPRG